MSTIDYLDLMGDMSKKLPEEADWMVAVHTMNDVLSEITGSITEENLAILVGLGAMMYRQGFREFQSGIGAQDVMRKLMKGGDDHE